MSKTVLVSELTNSSKLTFTNFDLAKAKSKYEQDKSNFIVLGGIKYDGKRAKVLLSGEVASDDILVAEFEKGKSFSLPLAVDETDDLDAFEKISEKLSDYIKEFDNEEYSFTTPVRDQKLYIKLKLGREKKSFLARNNLKLNPNKLENSGVYRSQRVDVVGEIGLYVNLKDHTAGLTFNPNKLTFEIDQDEPAPKKQKKQ